MSAMNLAQRVARATIWVVIQMVMAIALVAAITTMVMVELSKGLERL